MQNGKQKGLLTGIGMLGIFMGFGMGSTLAAGPTDTSPAGTMTASAEARKSADDAARERLAENVMEMNVDGGALEKVLAFLRDNMGGNMRVDWVALGKAGVTPNSEVRVSVKEVPFGKALRLVLENAGKGKVAFGIEEGVIVVTTTESLPGKAEVGGTGAAEANRRVQDILGENLKEITVEAQGLEKVLNFMRKTMEVNVYVDWENLKGAGVDQKTAVTVALKEKRFKAVLTAVLEAAGKGKMGYYVDEGVIMVTTKEKAAAAQSAVVAKKGDRVWVSIFEMVTPGLYWDKELEVDGQGNIVVENLGKVLVVGLSGPEIKAKIDKAVLGGIIGVAPGPGQMGPEVEVEILGSVRPGATNPAPR